MMMDKSEALRVKVFGEEVVVESDDGRTRRRRRSRVAKIAAPMVRYSKLPFRMVCREYGCDLAYTPMMMANSFVSTKAYRDIEFALCKEDRPLAAQFAGNDDQMIKIASEYMYDYCDAIDLNCGCPQRWIMKEGCGAAMISQPETVYRIVKAVENMPILVKIRIHKDDLRRTIEFCRQIEKAGACWLTVHGRTPTQPSTTPPDYNAIKAIKEIMSIPVVANGDCLYSGDFERIAALTGCDGVMSARGILKNPAIFTPGLDVTPWRLIDSFIHNCMTLGESSILFKRHLYYFLTDLVPRYDRTLVLDAPSSLSAISIYNELKSIYAVDAIT